MDMVSAGINVSVGVSVTVSVISTGTLSRWVPVYDAHMHHYAMLEH